MSRKKLSELSGHHKSTISNIFHGRVKPSLATALLMAEEMRIPIGELEAVLAKRQEKFRERSRKVVKAGAGTGTGTKRK